MPMSPNSDHASTTCAGKTTSRIGGSSFLEGKIEIGSILMGGTSRPPVFAGAGDGLLREPGSRGRRRFKAPGFGRPCAGTLQVWNGRRRRLWRRRREIMSRREIVRDQRAHGFLRDRPDRLRTGFALGRSRRPANELGFNPQVFRPQVGQVRRDGRGRLVETAGKLRFGRRDRRRGAGSRRSNSRARLRIKYGRSIGGRDHQLGLATRARHGRPALGRR